MTTPENIDGTLDSMASGIEDAAAAAYARFQELLAQDVPPRAAMDAVRATFDHRFYGELSAAFDKALGQRWTEAELKAYDVGNITLSQALYANWLQTQAVVSTIVDRSARGVQQARALALELYQGYGQKDAATEVLKFGQIDRRRLLPQELRELFKAPEARQALTVLEGRVRATTLRTAALQSAYLQAFDHAIEGAAEDRLQRLLKVAMEEKMRYFANRIAQTELALAHAKQVADELLADDGISVVQWRLSGAHPEPDICDLMAKVDRYGLGPGCFPKDKAPRPIAHPHCRCRLRSRPDLDAADAREQPGAELAYMEAMPDWQAARLVGSKAKYERVRNGETALDVWNTGKEERHQVPLLGKLPPKPGTPPVAPPVPVPPPAPPPVAPASPWAPRLPDPRGILGVQTADWHAASWGGESWLVQVAAKYQGDLKGLTNTQGGAFYSRTTRIINMPKHYTTASADNRGTWRHEFGHFLDHAIGGISQGTYRYRSSQQDFTSAMYRDAEAMKDRAKIPKRTTPKTAAARQAYLDSYTALRDTLVDMEGSAAREAFLEAQAQRLGFTLDELRAGFATETNAILDSSIGGQVRMSRVLRALENADAERLAYYLAEMDTKALYAAMSDSAMLQAWKVADAATRANWDKGNLGHFADLFGAATKNKLATHTKGFPGHSDAYYAERPLDGQQTEVFANLTAFAGGPNSLMWRIVRRMAPELSAKFEEIFRAET